MVEIQCSSCHTRYRIDENVLPDETPTFKCSRCGHVFSIEPRAGKTAASKTKEETPKEVRARRPAVKAPEPPARRAEPPEIAKPKAPPAKEVPVSKAAEPPPIEKSVSADPLARPFPDRIEEPEPGDSLSFDFNLDSDEHVVGSSAPLDEDEWETGEAPDDLSAEPVEQPAARRRELPRIEERPPARAEGAPRGDTAMPSFGTAIHSAGFFLAGFFFIAIAFGALSLLVAGEPTASAGLLTRLPAIGDRFVNPASSAVVVTLGEVRAEYRSVNGGHSSLVIIGQATNVGSRPLHEVQIAARLLDGGRQELAKQAIHCGNNLSSRMISQMTSRELEFFQRLGPPKTFLLQPEASCPFTIVFVDPPAHSATFAIEVERAQEAAPGALAGSPASPDT